MPIVYQWYNRNWAVDLPTAFYPYGVEVDVSQCDIFTQKQYVLYTSPPAGPKPPRRQQRPKRASLAKANPKRATEPITEGLT